MVAGGRWENRNTLRESLWDKGRRGIDRMFVPGSRGSLGEVGMDSRRICWGISRGSKGSGEGSMAAVVVVVVVVIAVVLDMVDGMVQV